LRGLIEKLMLDMMFDAPESSDVLSIKITRPVVLGESKPIVRRKQDQAAA
jgi:ATP-dependent protease Clp ATPase subunit